jgi:hypothetical protein
MALTYDFNFGPANAGLEATVTEVYTGTEADGSPVTLDSAGRASLPLDEGQYKGVVSNSLRHMTSHGLLNIPASVEAAMLAPEAP